MWITGDMDADKTYTNTAFVYPDSVFNPVKKGPVIPWSTWGTCVTSINSTHVIFNGGYGQAKKTLFINHKDNFKMTIGPPMKIERQFHMCSTLIHPTSGKTYLVVAGNVQDTLGGTENTPDRNRVEVIDLDCKDRGENECPSLIHELTCKNEMVAKLCQFSCNLCSTYGKSMNLEYLST